MKSRDTSTLVEFSIFCILEIRPEPFRASKLWTIVQSGRISMIILKEKYCLFIIFLEQNFRIILELILVVHAPLVLNMQEF